MFNFNNPNRQSTNNNYSMPNLQQFNPWISAPHNGYWPSTSAANFMDIQHVAYQQQYNGMYYLQNQYIYQNGTGEERRDDSGYNSRSSSDSSDSPVRTIDKINYVGRSKRRGTKKQNNKRTIDLLSYLELYTFVSSNLKLSKDEMRVNGYPVFEHEKKVTIPRTRYDLGEMFVPTGVNARMCIRCSKTIEIGPNGTDGICSYVAKGQLVKTVHVTKQMPESVLEEFVQTPSPLGAQDPRSNKIYAIDCEMVYTVAGLALARLSVINLDGDVVLDVLVKPPTKVLDPNTEYSGLTMKQLEKAKETVESCRQKLFDYINSETILVGHSLESDLKYMRMVHNNVVDTAILFAKFGRKVSLRRLSLDLLEKRIQEQNATTVGHNSAEDAQAAISLLKLKIQSMF